MKPCVTYYVGAGVVDASWPQPTCARSRGTQQGYLLAGEQQSRQDRYGDGPEAATRTGGNLTRSLAEERALPHYSGRERAAAFNGDAAQKRWGQSVLAGQRVCA